MIRTAFVARARRFVAALVLASVACAVAGQVPAPARESREAEAPALALLLPNQQSVFAQAGEAVRAGFFAAHAASGKKASIQVIEIDDDPVQLRTALEGARTRGVKAIVGPLPRAAVNAMVDGGPPDVPLIALNYPDREAGAPPTMIALGLSAEAEAQYVVRVALAEFVGTRRAPAAAARFVVLAGPGALERRIGQAYVASLRAGGESPLLLDTAIEPPASLARQLDPARVDAVFLALDARGAALLRARIARGILVFGTSLLNSRTGAASPEAMALAHDLDGVRFVDMPWLLRGDASMGAGGPLPAGAPSADMARLYALGADAYQVALRWSAGETRFAFDGMMGRLRLDRSNGARVERTPAAAIYRNGTIEREEVGR
jgi:outer membrane PBP1 activator LpoA protein